MLPVYYLLLWSAVGVDVGWQPLSDGGHEYIIQIEPHMLATLEDRQALVSDVPRSLDIRSFRVVVGNATLPREPHSAESAPGRPSGGAQTELDGIDLDSVDLDSVDLDGVSLDGADLDSAAEHRLAAQRILKVAPPIQPPLEQKVKYAGDVKASDVNGADRSATDMHIAPAAAGELAGVNRLSTGSSGRGWAIERFAGASVVQVILIGLFLSLGVNLFLAWANWSERVRYRTLLRQQRDQAWMFPHDQAASVSLS